MKFEVTLELLEEMAECIHRCEWVSGDEIAAYMKSCVTDGDYDPEDWSYEGKGQVDYGVCIDMPVLRLVKAD